MCVFFLNLIILIFCHLLYYYLSIIYLTQVTNSRILRLQYHRVSYLEAMMLKGVHMFRFQNDIYFIDRRVHVQIRVFLNYILKFVAEKRK